MHGTMNLKLNFRSLCRPVENKGKLEFIIKSTKVWKFGTAKWVE
jgi:hypothetical protein